LSALVWTSWAAASPASLRVFLGMLLKARNFRARAIAANPEPLLWSPTRAGPEGVPNEASVRSLDDRSGRMIA
jgi:hypothetical protein